MISIERCNKILTEDGLRLTKEQIQELRDFLYIVAGLEIENNNLIKDALV